MSPAYEYGVFMGIMTSSPLFTNCFLLLIVKVAVPLITRSFGWERFNEIFEKEADIAKVIFDGRRDVPIIGSAKDYPSSWICADIWTLVRFGGITSKTWLDEDSG